MTLPESVRDDVETTLRALGVETPISEAAPVAGGCINQGTRLTAGDSSYFLKWNPSAPRGMFVAEHDGLVALRSAEAVRVPEPLATSKDDANTAWLLMEHIPAAVPEVDSAERLGRGLAAVHASSLPGLGFGWTRNNWIGSLGQTNDPTSSWADFWREQRIAPQLALGERAGHLSGPVWSRLLDAIPAALDDEIAPALLHGDLWNGNSYVTEGGEPVLIDPAVYQGDGEVDLAMSELFGGFQQQFFDAYHDARPVSAAYRSHRRDLYQLFYLLVHVNLFGASYVSGAERAAARVVAALT
jgi:fructosamine-3-kinase